MVAGSTEREVKLDAPPGRGLADLDHLPGVDRVDDAVVELDAVYLDTPGLDLLRRGASLRHRDEPGGAVWTLKLPTDLGGGDAGPGHLAHALSRRELELADDGRGLPPALLSVVWPWVRHQEVAAVARLHTVRRRRRLLDHEGGLLAEVADDEVTVFRPADAATPADRFRELEVEAGPADGPAVLGAVVDALTAGGAVVAAPKPKAVRAVGPAADESPDLPGPPVAPAAGTDELVAAALRRAVGRVLDAEVALRAADTTDRTDDLVGPVAGMLRAERAGRALLRVLVGLVESDPADQARGALRRLASPLLRTHDALALADVVASAAASLDAADREVLAPVVNDAERDADAARHLLVARLASPAHLEHLIALVEVTRVDVARSGAGAPGRRRRSAPPTVTGLAEAAWGRFARAVADVAVDPTSVGRAVERLRPRARRAWAAAEVAAPTDEGWAGSVELLGVVVADLDRLRDLVTVEAHLRSLALGAPRDQVLALGQVVGVTRRAAADLATGLAARLDTELAASGGRSR